MMWGSFLAGLSFSFVIMAFIMNYSMARHMKVWHKHSERELELERLRYADPKKYVVARGAIKPDVRQEFKGKLERAA